MTLHARSHIHILPRMVRDHAGQDLPRVLKPLQHIRTAGHCGSPLEGEVVAAARCRFLDVRHNGAGRREDELALVVEDHLHRVVAQPKQHAVTRHEPLLDVDQAL